MPVGELPPPAPRDCFGRWELIEQVVNLAENLQPIALIGAGGIGKTSIALTVLHHNRMKERFGENRRFIRCDRFPASRANFLTRLSKVIGAGVDNPDGLMPLRPLLSSKEMLIILDNAESILDPQGTGAREIYDVVDELCRFKTISLCITSRATTVPRHCKRLEIPTLSLRSACDIFYSIYGNRGRSAIVDNLLRRLDFHALSIALLATTASHNGWDYDRLAEEWDSQRAQMLQTGYYESLATTIQLSLASPTFRSLGSNARDLLGVIAFFPQGVNEKNLKWLFPDIPNRRNVFDQLCVLSLTYRSNGFITMLAPLRDYLRPQYPPSSPLLCTTRDRYLSRLSIDVNPDKRGFEEARWIVSEDMNVEYLLDVFISIDQSMGDVWDPYYIWEPCYHFMEHLYWHKPRQTTLKSKIEALPDDHRSKPKCLSGLSGLFERVGNYGEQKRLLSHTLELERQRGDNPRVAQTLQDLSNANRSLQLYDEGLRQAKEALEIFKWIGDTEGQTQCLSQLAWLLFDGEQLDAAENTASHAINLASEKNQGYVVCKLHQVLGNVYRSKREKKKAIYHFETALKIASLSNWRDVLFWNNYDLATLFRNEGEFDRAIVHIKQAKSHAVDDAYKLGRAMKMQARVWYRQGRLEEAKSEALSALEIYERSGAADDAEVCRTLLQKIDQAMRNRPSRFYGELLEMKPQYPLVNLPLLA